MSLPQALPWLLLCLLQLSTAANAAAAAAAGGYSCLVVVSGHRKALVVRQPQQQRRQPSACFQSPLAGLLRTQQRCLFRNRDSSKERTVVFSSSTTRVFSSSSSSRSSDKKNENDLSRILTSRLPTSVEDQVRQAAEALKRANSNSNFRHTIRLLLPVIGASDLDDWPGGARQMMEAAYPLCQSILKLSVAAGASGITVEFPPLIPLEESDGVYAVMAQVQGDNGNKNAEKDACAVLLPTAETVTMIRKQLDPQVGRQRNLIWINPQWKRKSDFNTGFAGGFLFGGTNEGQENIRYVEEQFRPTFSLTNLVCEGESIRILRAYPGPWRVFVRKEEQEQQEGGGGMTSRRDDVNSNSSGSKTVAWVEIGQKDFVEQKPADWDSRAENQRDGGKLFDFGQPTYLEITTMITSAENYMPKNPAERAMAAFNFIKDTL